MLDHETSLLVGQEIQDQLPYNNYYEYYGPTYKLHIETSNMENLNTPKYLENQTIELYKVLNSLPVTPSVEYSLIVPRDKDQEDRDQEEEIRLSSTQQQLINTTSTIVTQQQVQDENDQRISIQQQDQN